MAEGRTSAATKASESGHGRCDHFQPRHISQMPNARTKMPMISAWVPYTAGRLGHAPRILWRSHLCP